MAVVLHGGFWRDAYDRSLMDELCEDLSEAGWAAWNLEYRRLDTGGGWPATFDDVAAGIDHLGTVARRGSRSASSSRSASRSYAEAARAAGDRVDLIVHEQLGHFEHLDPRSPAWRSVRDWLPL